MNKQQKDKGKQQPVLDRSKASDLNMAVLRRIDPQIEEVWTYVDDGRGTTTCCSCYVDGACSPLSMLILHKRFLLFCCWCRFSRPLDMYACTACLLMISSG